MQQLNYATKTSPTVIFTNAYGTQYWLLMSYASKRHP